jgi:hypothetical protein
LSRHRSLLLSGITAAAAASATVAAAAAIAAMATAVATMMAMMASATAATTTTATVAAIAATVMTKGHRLAVTAHQGDANDREEHGQTKNNNTVHPQILQLLTGTVSGNYKFAVGRRNKRDSRRLSVALAISP